MICHSHRLKNPAGNDEYCIYCEKDEAERKNAKLLLQIDVLTRNLKFIAEHPSTTDPKDDFEKCRAVACLTLDKARVISERGVTEKRKDEVAKCGVCGTEIIGNFPAVKEAWDTECEWYVCFGCWPKHMH